MSQRAESRGTQTRSVTLFLCGDVMTGRGIDQILPHPGEPQLFESYMRSALGYVELAERASGPIARPVDFAYVWGDALAALERVRPDARIVNLETAVTAAGDAWPGKRIHYRMHPGNVACLTAAKIDCCVLANNHAMDWGRGALAETLGTLHQAGMRTAGAGRDAAEAASPAVIEFPGGGRVLVFAFGSKSAGVPANWAATQEPRRRELHRPSVRARGRTRSRGRSKRSSVTATSSWRRSTGAAIGAMRLRRRSAPLPTG